MEFDKSRVYTTLNADELKLGSKVIPADNLTTLKHRVQDKLMLSCLIGIQEEFNDYRFVTNDGVWALVYLVSEPKKKKLKWTELKVGDIITNGKMECMVLSIDKNINTHFRICVITADGDYWLGNDDLKDWSKMEE